MVCKYSPNPWSINASHPKKAGKSGDSNLMLHGFGEYLPWSPHKSLSLLGLHHTTRKCSPPA